MAVSIEPDVAIDGPIPVREEHALHVGVAALGPEGGSVLSA